jgi:hypothetical protein
MLLTLRRLRCLYLEHGQEEMFFATLVLVSVDGEHYGLK